ncbi:Proteasome component ECM29 [Paramyrothecium foliicola]|nr:Proteasome component ECM29 [Paramyrothecium foliicola]
MAAASTEQRELQLVDNVEFKILAVANNEEKLQQLLQKFLAPLTLKAASDHASVRAKVIQVLMRLKTFIQPPSVILPVKALLEQYKSSDSAIIKQLDLSFIQHSVERLDEEDRRDLIPLALNSFSKDEGHPRAGTFFLVILRMLLDVRIPPRGSKDDDAFRLSVGLSDEKDAKFLAKMLALFFRLRIPTANRSWAQANPTFSQDELALFSIENPESQTVFRRMSELKTKLVALLASGAFLDDEKFFPALYAASSFDNRVASSAEEVVKRSTVSLEDPDLVHRLFQAHAKLPAAYRTRILTMLSKSSISTTMPEEIMGVVSRDFLKQSTGTPQDSLQPISALERTKLHKALFQYLSWVARVGPSKEGFTMRRELVTIMRNYVESQGWPVPEQTSADDAALRAKAYETIGMLCRGADWQVSDRLDLARWLFRSLSEDPNHDSVVNIDGALSSLAADFPAPTGPSRTELQTLLLTYITLPEEPPAIRSTRHAVVKWANQCLPFSDLCGRWIDILAVAGQQNERSDVIEQGHKGLDPWTYLAHNDKNPVLPDWKEMIRAFYGSFIDAEFGLEALPLPSISSLNDIPVFQNFSGARLSAYPVALRYCRQMMFLSALNDFTVEPDWMQTLDAQVRTAISTREKIRSHLRTVEQIDLVFYLRACLEGAIAEDVSIKEECIRCFVEVAALCPGAVIGHLQGYDSRLLELVKSNSKEIRSLSAKALGILVPHPVNGAGHVAQWLQKVQSLFDGAESAAGPVLNAAEGALLAFGHIYSRAIFYGSDIAPDKLAFPFYLLVNDGIQDSLFECALDAFAQLWSAGLAMPDPSGDYALSKIVEKLVSKAKKRNEKAIFGLGRLALCLEESSSDADSVPTETVWSGGVLGDILKNLFDLHEIKQVEIHFTVGDSLTAAIARWDSDFVKLTMDVEPQNLDFRKGSRNKLITAVLDKLFADCKSTKPSLLKASGIWLFCTVQYCSHLDEVQSRLRETQAAFMRLLSARDELVQETASRGLSLVYERGDADLKATLVKDLVSAFTSSGTQLKVDQDTELFEPGALPTGEGSSVTSYKDIVNLANEVGDQRLVYKFMSLAANAATWSTRSAFGRFGLSNILSESEVDPKLYPKLYRYRFDPNSNVQRSMNDIWKALVKDSAAVIDRHFDAILDDLLKSILGREWRMREACCAAIADLLQGRPFAQYEKRYREIWAAALKVLDDVKGSVREAALRLCMALSNSLVRQLEESNKGSAAKAMMQEALPFLLSDKALESSVQEVQIFATITVMKIAKQGGDALKTYIPDMVPQLLGLLSTIEPQQINYHYQRAGEESRDQIDKLRSQMVNQSPISEAIENCLRFIDEGVMSELAPRLEAVIKSAIGMPTKIGCSRVLSTLFTRHANDIRPVSARFLQMMEKQTLDKNDEVSQAYARATAYMMRVVSDSAKQRFCEQFKNLYLQSEEESRRQKIADVIVALAKVSPDHFTSQETLLLPFSYLGSHDVDEYTSKVFKEVWNQHAGSNRTVVRYIPEIVALVERCLDTTQWSLRHTGAFAVAAMVADVSKASEATGEISEANLKAIWPVFDKTLALKTFEGKEKLLESFPDFIEKGKALWSGDAQVAAQLKKVAIREAKRNNEQYRVYAFRCLWRFAKARDDLDMLQDIAQIVTPYLDELKDEDKMEVDSKEDLVTKTAKNGLEAIARGYNRAKMASTADAVLRDVVTTLQPYLSSSKFDGIKRQVWYECVHDIATDAVSLATSGQQQSSADAEDGSWAAYVDSLGLDTIEAGTETQRTKRIDAVLALVKLHKRGLLRPSRAQLGQLQAAVGSAINVERSTEVQKAWRSVQDELRDLVS